MKVVYLRRVSKRDRDWRESKRSVRLHKLEWIALSWRLFWRKINIYVLYFKERTLRINYLQGFRPSQPCLLPTWILVRSLDHTGLRFISQKNEKERKGEFFDSYGLPPSNYIGTFSSFLNGWSFNSVTLQSINSKVCGHYCLYYALFRSRNIGMSTIVHRFSKK